MKKKLKNSFFFVKLIVRHPYIHANNINDMTLNGRK